MATIKGIGCKWGMGDISCIGAAVVTNDATKLQSLEYNKTSDKKDIPDATGEVAGQIFYNHKQTLTVTVIPAATTLAIASNCVDNWLPVPGTTLTLIDSQDGFIAASSGTKFNVLSSKVRMSNDNFAMCDVELELFTTNATALTAAAITS